MAYQARIIITVHRCDSSPAGRPTTRDDRPMTLDGLIKSQAGVLSSKQAGEHLAKSSIQRLTAPAGRWQRPLPGVIVAHDGPLSREQQLWAAALYAGPQAALSHATSSELQGLKGYSQSAVHVLLPHGERAKSQTFVVVHRSRNAPDSTADVHPVLEPRHLKLPRSLVEMARVARSFDDARSPLAAAVQQALVRPSDLRDVLARVGPMRFQAQLFAALDDIEFGAHSGLELQFMDLVRELSLPVPTLQHHVVAGGRLRKLDARWAAYDVWVEIDGAAHRDDRQWQDDLDRHNEINVSGDRLCSLRFSGHLLKSKRDRCGRQLVAALRGGGWSPL